MWHPLKTVIFIFLSIYLAMIQTAQRDYTKGGLCEWFLSQKMIWFLLLPIKHALTKQLSSSVMHNARTMSRGAHLGLKKKNSSTSIRGFKESLSYSCKSYSQPPIRRKKVPLRCCIVGQCKLNSWHISKGACSLLLSLYRFSSFFHRLNPECWN